MFMPITINGKVYYRTAEVCGILGISRNTLFRWLEQRVVKYEYRDFRGWRLFTEDQIDIMKQRLYHISTIE
ncbi:MerR family transcriptional regulator [Chloroflexota bacterium]